MASTRSNDPLVWIDCEMTGLDPEKDAILEIACFITDAQLQVLDAVGWHAIIGQSQAVMDSMNDWCKFVHGSTGLTEAVLSSNTSAQIASGDLLSYIKQFVPQPRTALLAGNSVHADRAFLAKQPYSQVLEHLHYRILDVSSLKEAVRRWSPSHVLDKVPPKRNKHDAKSDILESISEAAAYRRLIFGAVQH